MEHPIMLIVHAYSPPEPALAAKWDQIERKIRMNPGRPICETDLRVIASCARQLSTINRHKKKQENEQNIGI